MIINSIVRELKANGDMSMDYLSHNVSENLKRIILIVAHVNTQEGHNIP